MPPPEVFHVGQWTHPVLHTLYSAATERLKSFYSIRSEANVESIVKSYLVDLVPIRLTTAAVNDVRCRAKPDVLSYLSGLCKTNKKKHSPQSSLVRRLSAKKRLSKSDKRSVVIATKRFAEGLADIYSTFTKIMFSCPTIANAKINTKQTRKSIFLLTVTPTSFKWSPIKYIDKFRNEIHLVEFNPGFPLFQMVHDSASSYIWHRQGNPSLSRNPPTLSAIGQSETRQSVSDFLFHHSKERNSLIGRMALKKGG